LRRRRQAPGAAMKKGMPVSASVFNRDSASGQPPPTARLVAVSPPKSS